MALSGKPLEKMSPEELGELFPIFLVEPDPEWAGLFRLEKEHITRSLGPEHISRLEHIGSTAIPGIRAKPSIDILLEVPLSTRNEWLTERLCRAGYRFIPRPENPPPHMMFVKGYTEQGFRGQAYHLHIRVPGDWDEIRFRDYLVSHPRDARAYEELKTALAARYKNDREGYTEAKSEFVTGICEKAKRAAR